MTSFHKGYFQAIFEALFLGTFLAVFGYLMVSLMPTSPPTVSNSPATRIEDSRCVQDVDTQRLNAEDNVAAYATTMNLGNETGIVRAGCLVSNSGDYALCDLDYPQLPLLFHLRCSLVDGGGCVIQRTENP